MATAPGAERPGAEPATAAAGSPEAARLSGVALLLGAAVLAVAGVLGTVAVSAAAYEGRGALVSVVTDPAWIPLQVAQTLGVLLVAGGGVDPLRRLARGGEARVTGIAAAAAGLGVVLDVIEFAIAALAAPGVFVRPLGSMLGRTEVEVILMGFQAIGIGLLTVSQLCFAAAFVLVGVAMLRSHVYNRAFAVGSVVIGLLLVPAGPLQHGVLVGPDTPLGLLGPLLGLLTTLWLVALGLGQLVRARRGR